MNRNPWIKFFTVLLCVAMLCTMACTKSATEPTAPTTNTGATLEGQTAAEDPMAALIAAAQAEGELVIYGSCEDSFTALATQTFEKKYGIKTSFVHLTGGEVQAKIEEENGNPSADVWFGATSVCRSLSGFCSLLRQEQ